MDGGHNRGSPLWLPLTRTIRDLTQLSTPPGGDPPRLLDYASVTVAAAAAYLAAHPIRRRPRRTPATLGLAYEPVRFPAVDGTRLAGWWVPASDPGAARATILLCHAYACNREQMLPCLPALHAAGYHALLFDFRAHGESGGSSTGIGHAEVADLLGALRWLDAHPTAAPLPVAALGLSMGGAAAILTAAFTERIAAVIADSVFPTLEQALQRRSQLFFGPAAHRIHPPVRRVWRRLHHTDPTVVAPARAIRRISPRPVFLIHCERDWFLSEEDARILYESAADPREFWHVPAVRHAKAHERYNRTYMRRVIDFLRRHGL